MPSSVRTLLVRPSAFFEQRTDRLNGVRGAIVAAVLSVSLTAVLAVSLRLFAQQFTGSTTVDNPAYPGDVFCEGESFSTLTPSGCDEPPTVTRDISALLWEVVVEFFPWVVVGLPLLWLLLAAGLHAGAWLDGGTGRFGETMAVTAWGLVPMLVAATLSGAALVAFATQADLAGSSTEPLLAGVREIQSGVFGLVFLSLRLGGAAWQAAVWAGGLRVVHDINRRSAAVIAVVVAGISFLLS